MASNPKAHLSEISTLWTVLRQAQGPADDAQQAQETILQRYASSIFRYLRAAVRDEDVANELYQNFALRFVRGDFARIDPRKGRFRNFLKRVLFNLVNDHYRARKKLSKEKPLAPDQAEALPEASQSDADREFGDVWKAELLARTWAALQKDDQGLYVVLRCRADNPLADSAGLAERLSELLGKPVTAVLGRKRLQLARERFAVLLVHEVRLTLVQPTREDLEQELIDLDLYERCKGALD